jgi:hypothetical protein
MKGLLLEYYYCLRIFLLMLNKIIADQLIIQYIFNTNFIVYFTYYCNYFFPSG